jgi:hypothetical protein
MAEKPVTQDDVRRAFNDLITVLTPEDRHRLRHDPAFKTALMSSRTAAILAHVESPEVLERRRQMQDHTGRINLSGGN